jgi:hypothetical protein
MRTSTTLYQRIHALLITPKPYYTAGSSGWEAEAGGILSGDGTQCCGRRSRCSAKQGSGVGGPAQQCTACLEGPAQRGDPCRQTGRLAPMHFACTRHPWLTLLQAHQPSLSSAVAQWRDALFSNACSTCCPHVAGQGHLGCLIRATCCSLSASHPTRKRFPPPRPDPTRGPILTQYNSCCLASAATSAAPRRHSPAWDTIDKTSLPHSAARLPAG